MGKVLDIVDKIIHMPPKAGRVESPVAMDHRIAIYPDGNRRIQGCYQWSEAGKTGWVWKDLPEVYVDATGQERKRAQHGEERST